MHAAESFPTADVLRRASATRSRKFFLRAPIVLAIAILVSGCASTNKWVSVRTTPHNPLSETLGLLTRQGPKPTPRTVQVLRRYDLDNQLGGDRAALLAKLNEVDTQDPDRENLYVQAELAYVGAKRADRAKHYGKALELYGSATLHAYRYLFDESYEAITNVYDPQFRRGCDLYNAALEGMLRLVQSQGAIRPGTSRNIKTANHECLLEVKLDSKGWHEDDFHNFHFVSDYEVHGLRNHYHGYGLGVPLIAVRSTHEDASPFEQYYPEDLSFPLTAFLRFKQSGTASENKKSKPGKPLQWRAVLELHDPLENSTVEIAQRRVPLETDLSTPLAHTLSQPALDDSQISTLGLLKPEKVDKLTGLYMLEPYQPDKIPVVMVHGLWSSPATWMEMFNDLRSDPAVRDHYQFWFYLYPTGQPFWFSAAKMREDLAQMRHVLDPQHQKPALDQTVLVGHSMGGLVSKLQTIDSGNDFWETLSERPFVELQGEPEVRQGLARTFFFDPNPSIRRVVTIGTPHRGSKVANDTTRWLGRQLIHIPNMILQGKHQLVSQNPNFFRSEAPLDINTSIDSLDPESPLLPVLLTADRGPWVKYHNIVGRSPKKGLTSWLTGEGDGVVSLVSASLENVRSQITVPAEHVSVHRHPNSILEVRRILMEHIAELRSFPFGEQDEVRVDEQVLQATKPNETAVR